MATTVRLLTGYILSSIPYNAGDLVSIDDATATLLVNGKIADNNANAINQAVSEGELIQYPAVDILTYRKGARPASEMLYFDYLSQRPSAAAFGVGICQIGAVAYISDGSAWTEVGTGAGGGGIATGRTVTASDTLALTDNNTRMTANHATVNIVLTIPNDATVVWPAEASVIVYQGLAATVSFAAGAGVTLHSPVASSGQYGILTALRIGANEWTQI